MSDEKKYYVYFLLDPRKQNRVIYVGKGCGGRVLSHYRTARSNMEKYSQRRESNIILYHTLRKILEAGFSNFHQITKKNMTEKEALGLEESLIKMCGRKIDGSGFLLNIVADRGQEMSGKNNPMFGKKHSDEVKRKQSIAHKGMGMGKANSMFGKKHSPETKAKLSVIAKNMSVETKAKIGAKNRGRIVSLETRKKISESCKGNKNPIFGKPRSKETKRKISETLKRRNKLVKKEQQNG